MKLINNGTLTIKNLGQEVTLYGWVQKKRDLGGLIFIDLRDRSGYVQLAVRPENEFYSLAESLKSEYVIKVIGKVCERESKNLNIPTGEIEIDVLKLELINKSSDLPFEIKDDVNTLEDTRLKYRYLDIRRNEIKDRLVMRSKISKAFREYFYDNDFIEVETPVLCKSTPEGARDYLVPSRTYKGRFFALPQSPQLFKQLLMVGGMERYFQIAKCYRDEDLRGDRQPEFTQVDVEMSFVNQDDVINVCEGAIKKVFKDVKGIDIETPIMRMKYDDAMSFYGSDKPDLRFDMKINDISEVFKDSDFQVFRGAIDNGGCVNAIVAKDCADKYSRKDIDKLTDFVKNYKAKGLAWFKLLEDGVNGSIAKALTDDNINKLKDILGLEVNDLVLMVADKYSTVKTSLGALRLKLGKELNLIKKGDYKLLWVTDFPLFEYSEEEDRYIACHHPFTMPREDAMENLFDHPEKCYSVAYDIVINGYESGGGSIRIHDGEMQDTMFKALGFTEDKIREKFGWFVDAFKYGTPPHGGFALGLDRWVMLLSETDNIRDVIAFPKTASAADLMCECPSDVDMKQLDDLGIGILEEKKD